MTKTKLDYIISRGHGSKIAGASGYLNEVEEATKVAKRVHAILRDDYLGNGKYYGDTTSTTQATNLKTIVAYHNSYITNLDISVHMNSSTNSQATGVETYEFEKSALGVKMCKEMSEAMGIKNRGAKDRHDRDLYFTRNTTGKSILLEVFFLSNKEDSKAYENNFEKLCEAIAKVIANYTGLKQYKTKKNTYTVVKGDNLYKIATANKLGLAELLKLNKGLDVDKPLAIGTILKIK